MSIWTSSSRLFTSSQCFHVTRTLVRECSSSGAARYLRSRQHNLLYSTNAADNAAPSQSLPTSLPRSSSDEFRPDPSISAPPKPQYDPSDNKLGHETEKSETFADHLVGLLKKKERERKRRRKPHRAPTKKNDIKVSEKKPQQPLESSDGLTKVLHSSTTSTPTFDCYIVRESWKGEPWSITENPTTVDQPPDVLRSTPPHTSPKEVSQEGSIGPSNESVLIGEY
ncbi:hypothetical protein GALMADRAFT_112690 [Galerina marginata CBS 339.88]|uniref:Uncharacterized protein n=1 Tax=Galerina marginata (strain CBS 339.88) TaxID=685588 RepID=A0A067THU8_GALM3|nr:hypothetical protein GALMADRAFT_112690 [Galerina marginata CBS 339.88]